MLAIACGREKRAGHVSWKTRLHGAISEDLLHKDFFGDAQFKHWPSGNHHVLLCMLDTRVYRKTHLQSYY